MTEEEKKAIKSMKKFARYKDSMSAVSASEMNIILNLVEKLQKENEELRQNYDIATTEMEELKEQKKIDMYLIGDSISKEIVKRDYIPKDKIRDKLDEIMSYTFTSIEERHQQNYAYDRIRELLEEEGE